MDNSIPTRLKKRISNTEYIQKHTSEAALYELLAEEAAELSHAASKMARILRKEVPTPKTPEKAKEEVIEEYTDVRNAAYVLDLFADEDLADYKLARWIKRLTQKEDESKDCAEKTITESQS